MFGCAKLYMFIFECTLNSVKIALNSIKLKFTPLSLDDRLEMEKYSGVYIYIPVRVLLR